jgi:hypothetical protein
MRCGSDHFPISFVHNKVGKRKNFLFCFEAMWIRDSRFMDCIRNWWQLSIDGSSMYKVSKNLTFMKRNLKIWNKESSSTYSILKNLSFNGWIWFRGRFNIRVFQRTYNSMKILF